MSSPLALNLLAAPAPRQRIPRIAIVFPFEGRVDVEVECDDSDRDRLFDYVLGDERRAALIERAFELAEEDAAA